MIESDRFFQPLPFFYDKHFSLCTFYNTDRGFALQRPKKKPLVEYFQDDQVGKVKLQKEFFYVEISCSRDGNYRYNELRKMKVAHNKSFRSNNMAE